MNRAFNIVLCILHLLLGIGFAVYFHHQHSLDHTQHIELSIREHVRTTPSEEWESQVRHDPSTRDVQILLVSFFLITACFHAVYAIGASTFYEKMVLGGNNWLRWIEYAITSTLMIYIIALLSGVKDQNVYMLLWAVNIGMITQGQWSEVAIRDKGKWIVPVMIGFLLLASEFSVIIKEFQQRVRESQQKLPKWLPFMIYILFAFFACFGVVTLAGGAFHITYSRLEKTFLILSLASKATLGGFLAYGTVKRKDEQV